MKDIHFGRRFLSFDSGQVVITSTAITERARLGEDEDAFVERLVKKYRHRKGTLEMVIKAGKPQYAIVTFDTSREDQ